MLLAGAVPKWFGSQPYRRLSGDCLRVLTRLRLVKPGLPQGTRAEVWRKISVSIPLTTVVATITTRSKPTYPNRPDWNAAEVLAAGRKTVSFCEVVLD